VETVGAGVALKITPTHTTSTGTIRLSGQVQGPIPRHDVIIDLLVFYRGQWEPFRTPQTDRSGRFTVRYRFQGSVGRFPFRAQVPGGRPASLLKRVLEGGRCERWLGRRS
jgi:hypothetical protein